MAIRTLYVNKVVLYSIVLFSCKVAWMCMQCAPAFVCLLLFVGVSAECLNDNG